LNNTVQIFPRNVIASMADIQEMPYFKAEEAAQVPTKISCGFFEDRVLFLVPCKRDKFEPTDFHS